MEETARKTRKTCPKIKKEQSRKVKPARKETMPAPLWAQACQEDHPKTKKKQSKRVQPVHEETILAPSEEQGSQRKTMQ